MSKSMLKQAHSQETYDRIRYRLSAREISDRMCIRDHNYCNAVKKPVLSSNNDPLQDYIRRTLAGKAMRRSPKKSVPIVYSTLSREKGYHTIRKPVQRFVCSSREDAPLRYIVTSNQKRPKNVLNRNGIKEPERRQGISQQFYPKEEPVDKTSKVSNRLDFIDQYIALNTNKFGYVALNETILKELGTAINECLSRKIVASKVCDTIVDTSKVKCEMLYEPISPAGFSEDDD